MQGPIWDDASILDDFVLPLDKTMAMVEYDAPPTWFHHDDDDDHALVFPTSPTPLEWNEKGNIGEGDALVPLVDVLDIDCLHDVDPPITMLHASMISPCDDLPIYDEQWRSQDWSKPRAQKMFLAERKKKDLTSIRLLATTKVTPYKIWLNCMKISEFKLNA